MTNDKKLDQDIFNFLDDLGLEPKLTKASGQVRGDGDITAFPFMVENKYRSTEGFSITRKDFVKATNQADRQGLKMLFCRRNKHGETVVSMDLTMLRWLIRSSCREE